MWAFLMAVVPLLGGFTQPLKDYISYKQQEAKANSDYKLALLTANTNLAIENRKSDSADLAARIAMTSQGFKQNIYIFFAAIITFSILFPDRAQVMWANFNSIPVWFTDLFKIMTLASWGIPVAAPVVSGMFGAVTQMVQDRREYKLRRLNIKAGFDALKAGMFPNGMTQAQVEAVNKMFTAMGINPDTGDVE